MPTEIQLKVIYSHFFNEVSNTLNKTVNKYDNILVTGDLNVDFSNSKMAINNYLCDFIDTFSLTNIVSYKTCFKTLNGTLFDNFAVKLVPLKQGWAIASKW